MSGYIYPNNIVSSRYYYLNTSKGRLRYVVHQLNIPVGDETQYIYEGTICGKRTAIAKSAELFTDVIAVPFTAVGGKMKFEYELLNPYTEPSDPTVTALFRTTTTASIDGGTLNYPWSVLCHYYDNPPRRHDICEMGRYHVFSDMFVGTNGKIVWGLASPDFFISDYRAYVTKNINSNTFGEITIGGRISSFRRSIAHGYVSGMQKSIAFILSNSVAGELVTEIPYSGIQDTDTDGGLGTYDFTTSDDIDFPPLPTLSAVNTGFVSLWSPTNEQMLNLSRYMWNADILTADFWKKLLANPMDLIFGLNIIPVDLRAPESSYIGTPRNVVVGLRDTQIEMDTITTQWIEYDCGYIDISETWGAYLDYDPYTKLDIYLPFCGVHPIRIDDFMPGRIHVKYHIDLLSGSCVAIIKSTKTDEHGDVLNSVVYQFMGNCATQIPVTATQYADAVRSAISIAASVGSMVATGVGGAAAASGVKKAATATQIRANTVSHELNTGASAVENVMNLKPSIERSGAIGSAGALLSVQVPYLILTRPRQAKPDEQQKYTGYPSFITEYLSDLEGWTEVQAIHLEGIPCTMNELSEIDELLKSGVIF